MENNKVLAIFNEAVTDSVIESIKTKHENLVHDFTNEAEFKAARKVRTEMNKLIAKIDRVGIDAKNQVEDIRSDLKSKVVDAYSGTVEPFEIEDGKRKAEAKRIKEEKERAEREQKQKLDMIKGASARAIHLSIDEIEDILQEVMSVDISSFDVEMRQEAQFAKDMSLAQLQDAFKFAEEKERMRKDRENAIAEMADKDREIEELKKKLKDSEPKEEVQLAEYDETEIRLAFLECLIAAGVDNWSGGYDYAIEALLERYPGANIPR